MGSVHIIKIDTPNLDIHPGVGKTIDPERIKSENGDWFTLGDLHGNALKLLYFATLVGAVVISPVDYAKFATIYHVDLLKDNHEGDGERVPNRVAISTFERLLNDIKVTSGVKLRLLGDDLADRGTNDYLTLKLIETLIKGGVELEIIVSNHTSVFVTHIEFSIGAAEDENDVFDHNEFKKAFIAKVEGDLKEDARGPTTRSLHALQRVVEKDVVTPEELLRLYNQYKTCLKCFSYDYSHTGNLVVYSHAPIEFETHIYHTLVEQWAHLGVDYQQAVDRIVEEAPDKLISKLSPEAKIFIINAINAVAVNHVQKNVLCWMFSDDVAYGTSTPVYMDAIWNRKYIDDASTLNVHGHNGASASGANHVSLDTLCGRADARDYPEYDYMTIAQSHTHKPDLAPTSSQNENPNSQPDSGSGSGSEPPAAKRIKMS